MAGEKEIDHVTGAETTGHEWDGIKELNRPLPRWWLWTLYACILWAIGYWIAYPAWPLISSHTTGMLGYSQRSAVAASVEAGRQSQAKFRDAIAESELSEVKANPDLLNFAIAGGKAAFGDNCAPCHGRGAEGGKGYPNLNDDDWIWGGKLSDIHTTLKVGIRSTHEDTRVNAMPKYGIDKILEPKQIDDVTEYVLQISGQEADKDSAERGKAIFDEQCMACHGETGKGNMELGAPNLTDAIWLYGGSKADIRATVVTGRGGVMPAWSGRLDAVTIKQLALYVHTLGGGQ